ncbi:hypothetical protein [Streptomyces violascens]|uniref:hypothetical protein n=1 Tax=Streptomyces violascens TaxID=67381 RepID=UPI0036748963
MPVESEPLFSELLPFRAQQAERAAVLLGDSVLALAWNPEKQQPTLRAYDPGFFFPQPDDEDDGFPTRVHLAWELPADDDAGLKARDQPPLLLIQMRKQHHQLHSELGTDLFRDVHIPPKIPKTGSNTSMRCKPWTTPREQRTGAILGLIQHSLLRQPAPSARVRCSYSFARMYE